MGHEIHLPPGEYSFELAAGLRNKTVSMDDEFFTAKNAIVTRATLRAGRVYCARSNWKTVYSTVLIGRRTHHFRPTLEDRGSVVEWALAHPEYDNAAGDWSRLRSQQPSRNQ